MNFRASKNVRRRLAAVISPTGAPLSERAPIPSATSLLLERKEHRAQHDSRLLETADAVQRLRQLEVEGRDGEEREIKELKERKDVQDGVRKGINGALKRLKEAGKMRWRFIHRALEPGNCFQIADDMRAEAEKWHARSVAWLRDAFGPLGRSRSKFWREEVEWRGNFAQTIAINYRRRVVEAEGYAKRIEAFAQGMEISDEGDAQVELIKLEEQLLKNMAKVLVETRGVYAFEIQSLREEGKWLLSREHLVAEPWRWDAHQIQLNERGRLTVDQVVEELKTTGRNSLVWYTAISEAVEDPTNAKTPEVRCVKAGLQARGTLLNSLLRREEEIKEELREVVDVVKKTKGGKPPSQLSDGEHKEVGSINQRAKRNVGKAIDLTMKAVENEGEAEEIEAKTGK